MYILFMELLHVLVMHSTKRKCLTTFYAASTVIIALEILGRWHVNFPIQKTVPPNMFTFYWHG